MPRSSTLIWDLPVRLFHWALALGFAAAAGIALGLGEHSPLFPYHSIIGLTLALMVVLRIAWGIFGSRHARLRALAFGPGAVARYLKGIITGSTHRDVGHNPASAYAIFAMLALVLAIAATGIVMATGDKSVKEIHELLTYALLAVVGVHIVGVIVHTVRHRDPIALSMIHGRKDADPAHAISSAHPWAAVVFIAITAWWTTSLVRSFNASTGSTRLPILGTALQIGEDEERERRARPQGAEDRD